MNKVSVITICYNSRNFIERTIKSVLEQDYKDIEYIIIDGGSTDGTKEIIERYAERLSYWCSEKDGGIYDAMNKGIKHVTGDWINFMNSGDCFATNDALSKVMIEKVTSSVRIIYGDVIKAYADSSEVMKATPLQTISYKMPFCHQSCIIRADIQDEFLYDTSFKIAADYDFFYKIWYLYGKGSFHYVPFCISKIDCTDSLTHNNQYLCWKEFLKIRSAHKDLRYYWDMMKKVIKQILGYEKK